MDRVRSTKIPRLHSWMPKQIGCAPATGEEARTLDISGGIDPLNLQTRIPKEDIGETEIEIETETELEIETETEIGVERETGTETIDIAGIAVTIGIITNFERLAKDTEIVVRAQAAVQRDENTSIVDISPKSIRLILGAEALPKMD